jgi:uncharacterized protein (TIGR02271 family)
MRYATATAALAMDGASMSSSASNTVLDSSGRRGTIEAQQGGIATLRLESGTRLDVPQDLLHRGDDGHYRIDASFEALAQRAGGGDQSVFLEAEEHLKIDKRVRETGRVLVQQRVETHSEEVDEEFWREAVEIERVPVDRFVDQPAEVRTEGDTTIVPVHEEVLVVEKRLMLKEELHLTKRTEDRREQRRVTLRSQSAHIERSDPDEA